MTNETKSPHTPAQRIPGERDPENLTHREPGAMGGHATGADIPPDSHLPWMDDATADEHAHEGGKKGPRPKA